jgi:hypothetical protein
MLSLVESGADADDFDPSPLIRHGDRHADAVIGAKQPASGHG